MKVFSYLWGALRRLLFVLYVCTRGVVWVIVLLILSILLLFITAFCWLITPIDYIVTGSDRHPSCYVNWWLGFYFRVLEWGNYEAARRFLRLQ